ncbi:uncharacterized protein LOC126837616 [Adelges cooleyi]|uniref:uncharacterized protein LOC126837615 n=1 Tax=Adelges cooleyi TaxID=133065 RepID=UPI00217F8D2C|nr:uncharacterized protein LOC126837615 [Adelges cooleyi]XP_050427505.1 uncharacterized protein LOC126837616 [Adelges cooleyi]
MFLKFSVSFLFFILAISCMHTGPLEGKNDPEASGSAVPEEKINVTPEDLELIEEAFEGCRKLTLIEYDVDIIEERVGLDDYYLYMGDSNDQWEFVKSYFETYKEWPSYFSMTSDIFRDLFIIHCEKSGLSVSKIAEQRKAKLDSKITKKGYLDWKHKLNEYLQVYVKRWERSCNL